MAPAQAVRGAKQLLSPRFEANPEHASQTPRSPKSPSSPKVKFNSDEDLVNSMQQFLDEWNYRCVHSGLIFETDKNACMATALDLFCYMGVELSEEDKEMLMQCREGEVVGILVTRLPFELRQTFEHFALQLQLAISATTRVRHAIEEGDGPEIQKVMEEGDTGITQQILRRCIHQASTEVSELNEVSFTWAKSTEYRLRRLRKCGDYVESTAQKLEAMEEQIQSFFFKHSEKSKAMLESWMNKSEEGLVEDIFVVWRDYAVIEQQEKRLRAKMQIELEEKQQKCVDVKQRQKLNVLAAFFGREKRSRRETLDDCWRRWIAHLQSEVETEVQKCAKSSAEKMHCFKQANKGSALDVFSNVLADRDEHIIKNMFKFWRKITDEQIAIRMNANEVKDKEKMIAEHITKSGKDAKVLLTKMIGEGAKGLIKLVREAWAEVWHHENQEKELVAVEKSANQKFDKMKTGQKKTAMSVCTRRVDLEDLTTLTQIFQLWHTHARVEHVVKHYGNKMDAKTHQLEAVQTMFKSFATQLEQGIGSTSPRSQRKASASASGNSGSGGAAQRERRPSRSGASGQPAQPPDNSAAASPPPPQARPPQMPS